MTTNAEGVVHAFIQAVYTTQIYLLSMAVSEDAACRLRTDWLSFVGLEGQYERNDPK